MRTDRLAPPVRYPGRHPWPDPVRPNHAVNIGTVIYGGAVGTTATLPARGNVLIIGRVGKTNLARVLAAEFADRPNSAVIAAGIRGGMHFRDVNGVDLVDLPPESHAEMLAALDSLKETLRQRIDHDDRGHLAVILDGVDLRLQQAAEAVADMALLARTVDAQLILTAPPLMATTSRWRHLTMTVDHLVSIDPRDLALAYRPVWHTQPIPSGPLPADPSLAVVATGKTVQPVQIYHHPIPD
ncbi:hypothetical protein ACFFMN_23170 [Planobispora siamensis]|uniref:Uncharacterized protein n=1 Tax=Planobispora siamensis TaxID=936338 RepID=A0A8J3STD2_9ACTN|nr:hypothetical protein [Planobispora siamensis]GIH95263.1 hypothetical protein Psi01_58930 [Planobispora siamensis]